MTAAARPRFLENVRIVDPSRDLDEIGTIVVAEGTIRAAGRDALNQGAPEDAVRTDCTGLLAVPGLVDARVFIGEPGGEHRETIASASAAAAAGGVTTLVMMPDTDPVIDDVALVEFVLKTARDEALVNVHPAAALTKGLRGEEMSEIGLLHDAGAVAFTNGRATVRSAQVMRRAMTYARRVRRRRRLRDAGQGSRLGRSDERGPVRKLARAFRDTARGGDHSSRARPAARQH